MKIFYFLSSYISHRLAGAEYIRCLQSLGHNVFCNYPGFLQNTQLEAANLSTLTPATSIQLEQQVKEADLVIIHEEPAWYAPLFEQLPVLETKKIISYLPWENEKLPQAFLQPLSRVERIWTCSEFCAKAFKTAFSNVDVLPHVVRRVRPAQSDLLWAKDFLAQNGVNGGCLFFSVIDSLNPRKNLPALLSAFELFRRESKASAHLLLKQYRTELPVEQQGVISLGETLGAGRMAALHALSTAYISPHYAEGWGLGLSEAMSFGKIAIATGYSGNLEFMNNTNSILLPFKMVPVSDAMIQKIPLFTKDMQWAEVDITALVTAMCRVAENRVDQALGKNAAQINQRFGVEGVSKIMQHLL